MIDLYFWPTPNGWKISIMLEECGIPYNTVAVHIGKGEQFEPEFLAISPNNRMPAIVDHEAPGEPLSVFESGAILIYLAEKSGRFMPSDVHDKYDVMQWLFWQMAGLGPMAGQLSHFTHYAPEQIDYAVTRYANEYNRLLGVMNQRLADREYIAGDYSIADMASWPWVRSYERFGQSLDDFPRLEEWFLKIADRPAVIKGMEVGKGWWEAGKPDEETVRNLFGQTASSIQRMADEQAKRE